MTEIYMKDLHVQIEELGNRIKSLQGTGNLVITSSPTIALIFIDNNFTNQVTPTTITYIPSGWHVYSLQKQGFNEISGVFLIDTDKTTFVEGTLPQLVTPTLLENTITTAVSIAFATLVSVGASIYGSKLFTGGKV